MSLKNVEIKSHPGTRLLVKLIKLLIWVSFLVWVHKYTAFYGGNFFPKNFEEFVLDGIAIIILILLVSDYQRK